MYLSSKPEMLMLYSYIKLIGYKLSELRVVESEGQAVVIFILSTDTTIQLLTILQYRAVSLFPTRNDGIAVIPLFKPSSVKGKC